MSLRASRIAAAPGARAAFLVANNCTAKPYRPYPTLPYPTLPYPILPFPELLYPTLPYPILPCPALPYSTSSPADPALGIGLRVEGPTSGEH